MVPFAKQFTADEIKGQPAHWQLSLLTHREFVASCNIALGLKAVDIYLDTGGSWSAPSFNVLVDGKQVATNAIDVMTAYWYKVAA